MIHLVGLPSMLTHWERSLPSKRTTASEGALPTWSSELGTPGVTTGGKGRSRSWSSQFGSGWAKAVRPIASGKTAIATDFRGMLVICGEELDVAKLFLVTVGYRELP